MMNRFCRYIDKVFDCGERIAQLKDPRQRPRIPLGAIWGSVFFLFVLRQRSLNGMEGQLRQPQRMERLIGAQKPSADRMGQVLSKMDPQQLRALLSGINHQWGRNKGLKNGWPFRVGALDGHEFFPSRRRCCPQWLDRRLVIKGKEVITRRHHGRDGWVREKETHHWVWVTTLPAARLSNRLLWQVGHSIFILPLNAGCGIAETRGKSLTRFQACVNEIDSLFFEVVIPLCCLCCQRNGCLFYIDKNFVCF